MPKPIALRWLVRGDLDGFFGLGLDNFLKILLIVNLCQGVLDFPPTLIYGRILPGVALSLLASNLYYSWLAYQQGKQQRKEMTALPSGLDTASLYAYIFLVMLPARLLAIARGFSPEEAAELAWQAGLVACMANGSIVFCGAAIARELRRITPRAALLSALGGMTVAFMAMGFFFRTFAYPVVAFVPLGVIFLTYFGKVRFPIPGSLLAILLGISLAWSTGFITWNQAAFAEAMQPIGAYFPRLWLGELWQGRDAFINYFTIILPMGLSSLVNSLQNLDSAEAAGDSYPITPSLMAVGVSSIFGAISGSCFPTTIYLGHPGWKAIDARRGYTILNGLFMALLCLTGTGALLAYFIPIEAGMAIILWIAIAIVAQSFTAIAPRQAPAVVVGMLPGIAAWGAGLVKNALRVAGMGTPDRPFTPELISQFQLSDTFMAGALALEQGFILAGIALAAITAYIIDRQFHLAAAWALGASLLSWFGLMHGYQWTDTNTAIALGWGTGSSWAFAYFLLFLLLLYAHWQKE